MRVDHGYIVAALDSLGIDEDMADQLFKTAAVI